MNKKSICLNMIVKNESHVIRRSLTSVKPIIDHWVIVDTGSTDGTQEIIRKFMQDIPGELHERPWVDFGHNRNEALALARNKAEYILFIDADDRLVFEEGFVMPDLDKDSYFVIQQAKIAHADAKHQIILLIKDNTDFSWVGAVHEMLASPTAKSYALLTGVVNEYLHDGHRAKDPEKGKKDTELLLKALEKDPENSRYVFYLAQSYNGIGDLHEAIKFYEKRATMGGDEEEVFCSLKYAGTLQRYLGFKQEVFMENFYKAFLLRPSRAEPLFEMTKHFIAIGNHLLGYLVAKFALRIPAPFGLLVETWIYDWGILLQLYLCALELEYYSAAYEALKKLLFLPNLPAELREGYEPHLDWLAKKIFAKN